MVMDELDQAAEAGRPQSWWHWLVYGPDVGPPLIGLRNPQGVCVRGDEMLIADQGFPAVLRMGDPRAAPTRVSVEPPPCPVDVAVDDQGRVFVADTTRRAVLQYSPDGRLERTITPTDGAAYRPASVLFTEGVLYIGDSAGHRVLRFDIDRDAWLEPLGSQIAGPPPIAPVGLARTESGELVIVDAVTGLIRLWNEQNGAVRDLGRTGRGPCEFVRPMHVATAGDLVFVTDAAKQSVIVLDLAGECLAEIGASPDDDAKFSLPSGIAKVPDGWHEALADVTGREPGCAVSQWLIVTDALGETPLRWIGVARDCPGP
jgi:sugar lactone lactonase YvrE